MELTVAVMLSIKVIAAYLISLNQFVSYFFKKLGIFLLASYKEVKRINAQSDNTENQEDDEITKTSDHEPVPLY